MKKNLGRAVLFIIILLQVNSFAYEWSSSVSKEELFLHDTAYLKYECAFEDRGESYVIDFSPQGDTPMYTLVLLRKGDKFKEGKRTAFFEYVLKTKKVGIIDLNMSVSVSKTTQENISFITGSLDDEKEEYKFATVVQEFDKVQMNVKETKSDLYGLFSLEVKKDTEEKKAFEPYHLEITIKGDGNLEYLKPIVFSIEGVKVFSQKVDLQTKLTKDGYKSQWKQKFAFVSEKSFTIPKSKITYFDSKTHIQKTLEVDSLKVSVTKAYKKEELLDEVIEEAYVINYNYLYYALTFIFGVLVGKIKIKRKKLGSHEELKRKKIDAITSLDALLIYMVLEDSKKFTSLIKNIESGELKSLNKAKKKLLEF